MVDSFHRQDHCSEDGRLRLALSLVKRGESGTAVCTDTIVARGRGGVRWPASCPCHLSDRKGSTDAAWTLLSAAGCAHTTRGTAGPAEVADDSAGA